MLLIPNDLHRDNLNFPKNRRFVFVPIACLPTSSRLSRHYPAIILPYPAIRKPPHYWQSAGRPAAVMIDNPSTVGPPSLLPSWSPGCPMPIVDNGAAASRPGDPGDPIACKQQASQIARQQASYWQSAGRPAAVMIDNPSTIGSPSLLPSNQVNKEANQSPGACALCACKREPD